MRLLFLSGLVACVDGGKDSGSCDALSVEACASRSDCTVIDGGEITIPDTGGACYDVGSATDLGCMSADVGCGEAITFATDPSGHESCYRFSNTCVPEGWVSCEPDYNTWEECGG